MIYYIFALRDFKLVILNVCIIYFIIFLMVLDIYLNIQYKHFKI